ncbi:hypothetical protein A5676_08660 [Mycobacterium malmoense]|uniref:hypothetical protein n=1 Tax=Mycobacterium malmoense TaxID=1780 RepID=UPI00080BDD33|nr:hypothetical protein [Mycobacterium malmoense]OCB30995.1 hypothetical protein A5676_08660 [Mycobacterium malmoense]
MGIRSNAHFGVKEQVLESVIREVRDALQSFDAAEYGVADVRVESGDDGSFIIKFAMESGDAEQADADAERAVEAIKEILREHFGLGEVRERQRELTLA